jgi:hypothetical protein
MTFPFRHYRVRQPIRTLNGLLYRPRPVINVSVMAAGGSRLVEGLLDTGADDTLFPADLAEDLGIDLSGAPTMQGAGFGMTAYTVHLVEVALRIADNKEQREWKAWVGFTSAPLRQPLLGYAGFLQFFDATFFGQREEVELTVNSAYSGT